VAASGNGFGAGLFLRPGYQAHRKLEEQQALIAQQQKDFESKIAEQQKRFDAKFAVPRQPYSHSMVLGGLLEMS
jgi:hypothetical protein